MATDFTRTSLRLAAAALVAGGLAACSTIEDLDPTGMLGSDSTTSDASGIPADGTQTTADNTTSGIPQPDEAAQPDETGIPPDSGAQPDVASIPDRPQAPSSDADNAQTASSLQADAENVQYSAESLRGGTEASAPPPDGQPAQPTQVASAAPPPAQTPPDTADVPAGNVTPGTMGAETAPAQPAAAPPPSDSPLTEAPAQPA
ncbi:MAG TPA: hypothetical protein VMS78_04140, partial [Rhizomicrobium sp.]|nr:hypothetical protein [Rhizomicrobium sp.]